MIVAYRDIPDFPGYRAGDDGSIWSCHISGTRRFSEHWTRLNPSTDKQTGYSRLQLRRDGKSFRFSVHTLILTAFVGACPEGMEACHYPNRNRTDNRLVNLRWDTPKRNAADRLAHGTSNRGAKHASSVLADNDVLEIVKLWTEDRSWTMPMLARRFNTKKSTIQAVLNGSNWAWLTGITNPRQFSRYKSKKDKLIIPVPTDRESDDEHYGV